MRNNYVYVVTAYRFGDRERHSYVVGVYTKKHAALEAAEKEQEWRGGNKYDCEVMEIEKDAKWSFERLTRQKTIKEIKPLI